MKKLVGITAAGVCSTALVVGGLTLGHGSAQAAGNCHAYGATTAVANRAIEAACTEVNNGTRYSWAGGHHAEPGPSTGAIYDRNGQYFDDRNNVGLDCSGLVRWAWYQATGTDFGAGSTWVMPAELTSHGFTRTGGSAPTRPGDIVLYTGHTAIYLGGGLVVQAANHRAGLNVVSLALEPRPVTGVFRYTAAAAAPSKAKPKPSPRHTSKLKPAPQHTSKPEPTPDKPKPKPEPKRTHRDKPKPKHTTEPKPKTKPKTKAPQVVLAEAPSYLVPVTWHPVGVVHRGTHHFACQRLGLPDTFRGHRSPWWLKTDDDSGNQNVWVNAAYARGGGDGGRVPGVPTC